jgi:hypothetical protein
MALAPPAVAYPCLAPHPIHHLREMTPMRLAIFFCAVGTLLCWALAALNFWLYLSGGTLLSILAAFWCTAMAAWTTYSTVGLYMLDRDHDRSTIR